MANLAVSNTLVPGAVITAAGENQNFADVVNYINARNGGSTPWDNFNAAASTITGNAAVNGNITVGGNSTVTGNSAITGNETVGGNMGITGTITVGGVLGGITLPGMIMMYGAASAPSGWLLCDGSAVSRTTYSVLFGIIGTTYGAGDASTTFNVPDMQGVFPKGAGTTARSAGKDASGNFYAGTLGTYSTDQFQGHVHTILDTTAAGATVTGNGNPAAIPPHNGTSAFVPITGGPSTDGTNGTPRSAHTTEPQSLGLAFIIKT